jgi:hypothetical protein
LLFTKASLLPTIAGISHLAQLFSVNIGSHELFTFFAQADLWNSLE